MTPVRVTITIEQRGDGDLWVYSDADCAWRVSSGWNMQSFWLKVLQDLEALKPELFEPLKETEE